MKITTPRPLARSHRRVLDLTRWLEQVRTGPAGPWQAEPGVLTCDGGALATVLIADRLHIPARLCVGLYWHTDAALRAQLLGVDRTPGPDGDAAWSQALAEVEASSMDEHHHWALLWPGDAAALLVDPNGPVRGEQYVQLVSAADRYVELPAGPDRDLVYSPDDDWDDIAGDLYPGLLATLAATRP